MSRLSLDWRSVSRWTMAWSITSWLVLAFASAALGAPIHDAVVTGREEMVERVLAADPKAVNVRDNMGLTPLHLAAKLGDAEMITLLVSKGADLGAKDTGGNTCLHLAVRGGQLAAVKALVTQKGIDLNARNDKGETPLRLARNRRLDDVVRVLKEAGARS